MFEVVTLDDSMGAATVSVPLGPATMRGIMRLCLVVKYSSERRSRSWSG